MDMRLGIIFDGGGFTGAYSVGYAKAVYDSGLKPICCQGVSVGSLTGASYVAKNGDPREAEQTWFKIEHEGPHSIFPMLDIPRRIRKGGLFSNKGIYRLASGIDYQQLVNSAIRFDAVVYNEDTGKQEVFSTRDEHFTNNPLAFKSGIVASCSMRGFLEPVLIDGNFYSDGISFLIKPLVQTGCNAVFIFLNEPSGVKTGVESKWWLSRLLAGIHAMNNLFEDKEIESAQNINCDIATFNDIMKEVNNFGIVKRFILKNTFLSFHFTFEGKWPVRLVIFRPTKLIPTLWSLGFEKNDISGASKNGYESGSRIIEDFLNENAHH